MADLPAPRLLDRFGRVGRDLRVSVTDRCNLRCTYCMPAEGLDWLPKPEMLTDDELVRLVRVLVGLGVTQVRLTGGEPLLRRSLVDIVRQVAALDPRPRIAMTTNGIGLDRLAAPLAAAGLDRVNVSLDTIDPAHFARLTRRDRFDDVVAGLKAAADAGLAPVKVNAVAMRGVNDTDVPDLLPVVPRPRLRAPVHRADAAGPAARLGPRADGPAAEILERLGERFTLTPWPSAGAPRPSCSSSTAARRPSASSRASPRRSAAAATGSGSPPTASCATACSPGARSTCAGRCARGERRRARGPRRRRDVGEEGRARHRPGRLRAAASARCQRSVADSSGPLVI